MRRVLAVLSFGALAGCNQILGIGEVSSRGQAIDARADAAADAPPGDQPDAVADAPLVDAGAVDASPDGRPDADLPDAAPPVGGLVINELDYDTYMIDNAEFIELYNGGTTTADLSSYVLVLENGANGAQYQRIALTGAIAPGGFHTIGDPTLATTVTLDQTFATDNFIQNGSPDGVGLFYAPAGQPMDLVGYEGSIAIGQTDFGTFAFNDVLPGVLDSNTVNQSFARIPDGGAWASSATPTPGATNQP